MERISVNNLQAVVDRINKVTGNNPASYTKTETGFTGNIGNYHLSGAYGGYALHQMVNDGGGVRDIFGGFRPKRELYDLMQAYLKGIADFTG